MGMNDALAEAMTGAGYAMAPRRQPTLKTAEKAIATSAQLVRENERLRQENERLQARIKSLEKSLRGNSLKALGRRIAEKTGFELKELQSPDRTSRLVRARDILCWHAKNGLGCSYGEIGKFVNRDHSSVIASVRRHQARINAGEAS